MRRTTATSTALELSPPVVLPRRSIARVVLWIQRQRVHRVDKIVSRAVKLTNVFSVEFKLGVTVLIWVAAVRNHARVFVQERLRGGRRNDWAGPLVAADAGALQVDGGGKRVVKELDPRVVQVVRTAVP